MSQCWLERVWLTAVQYQWAIFWLLSDQNQADRREQESKRGLFVQSETDELNPSSARYSLSVLNGKDGDLKGAGGGETK